MRIWFSRLILMINQAYSVANASQVYDEAVRNKKVTDDWLYEPPVIEICR